MTDTFEAPPGMVGMTSYGDIKVETAMALCEARSFAEKQGLTNVNYRYLLGGLVDKARNDAVRELLETPAQWLLFIDGDMAFAPDAIVRLVGSAYRTAPHIDVLSAYCNLRGGMKLPTLDTGTGTWESQFPGQGIVPVMRTGAAFLLIKRHVLERIPHPWFQVRVPMKTLDALAEIDTFTRTIFDGTNPLRGTTWDATMEAAIQHHTNAPDFQASEVGEDSGFCDRVTGMGMRVAVDTDVVIDHLVRERQTWMDHRKAMDAQRHKKRLVSGFTT